MSAPAPQERPGDRLATVQLLIAAAGAVAALVMLAALAAGGPPSWLWLPAVLLLLVHLTHGVRGWRGR
ncbi:hypothetical protein [Kineococcus sp. SYSU DK005]|uniref:hypothetical protein n=1 Tax=Kineococcus sp. SYSU DK005 TaxID=3383126 RepID=UPI003D7D23F7